MANAVLLQKTLRVGVDEALYGAAGGAVNATGAMAAFGFPPQMGVYRGIVVFQSVQVGGTVTTATFKIETAMAPQGSINGQTAWETFAKLANFSASPATVSAYSGLPLIVATVGAPISVDLSGMGGCGLIRLNFTALTLGTGTGIDVYARIG